MDDDFYSEIKLSDGKYICRMGNKLIGKYETWFEAYYFLGEHVKEIIQIRIKNIECEIKRNKEKQVDVYYPKNQDDEATKAILDYYANLKEWSGDENF